MHLPGSFATWPDFGAIVARRMSSRMDPPRVVNISDLRRLAKRRLPRVVFDYIDGGADAEVTLRDNCASSTTSLSGRAARWRRRAATSPPPSSERNSTCLSSSRRWAAAGCSIRAAKRRRPGPPARRARLYILSTLSGCRLEDVKAATSGPALVPALSGRRARCGARRDRAGEGRGLYGPRRDHRHAGRGHARTRSPQRHARNFSAAILRMLPYLPQMLVRPGWLVDGFWPTAA